MPRTYTRTGSFKADTTYRFHCEYCGRDYSATSTLEKEVKLSLLEPPTDQQFLATAQREFKRHQDSARSLWEKGQFAVDRRSATCPHCGFLPTYMVNRSQILITIALLLIVGAGVVIPLVVSGVAMPTSMVIMFSLVLLVPYLLLMGLLVRRLTPNGKLMRVLRSEGRRLAPPQKPQIVFGPIEQK
jgi:hypothetical protein